MTELSRTATVEVLTAEVRVLMVGSRQVTLSVFNQLDWTDPHVIDPMGRVNAKDGPAVIGRDANGVLIRAHLPRPSLEIDLCNYLMDRAIGGGRGNAMAYRGYLIRPLTRSMPSWSLSSCEADKNHLLSFHPSTDELDELITGYERDKARRSGLEALPLIVLAGLR